MKTTLLVLLFTTIFFCATGLGAMYFVKRVALPKVSWHRQQADSLRMKRVVEHGRQMGRILIGPSDEKSPELREQSRMHADKAFQWRKYSEAVNFIGFINTVVGCIAAPVLVIVFFVSLFL